jgi:hypothetical protein
MPSHRHANLPVPLLLCAIAFGGRILRLTAAAESEPVKVARDV